MPQPVSNELLRNSLKLAVAVFVTATIAVWTERIEFVWYPVLAAIIVVDDNDDQTISAASARILGTVMGGLITFLVHTILSGWIGVLVSLLLMIPVLQLLGWQSALGTAGLTSVMFLMLPSHAALNWDYVFNRGLDTVVGCVVAIGVGLLFWPRSSITELTAADRRLRTLLQTQLQAYGNWLGILKGTLTEQVSKGGTTFTRTMNGDREYTKPAGKAASNCMAARSCSCATSVTS